MIAPGINMIIIFGNKVRYKPCPPASSIVRSAKPGASELRQARNWFALYFIPVFPLNQLGEAVTCLTCGMNFAKDVLSMPVPSNTPLDRFTREAQSDMDSGTPIEMARQKLINTGLSRDLVDQVIAQAAGLDRKRCPTDNLTYRAMCSAARSAGRSWCSILDRCSQSLLRRCASSARSLS
jgi:hypothetical protein